jgi:DNA-directed RNA polymerase I, II, and III subunit RPABC2
MNESDVESIGSGSGANSDSDTGADESLDKSVSVHFSDDDDDDIEDIEKMMESPSSSKNNGNSDNDNSDNDNSDNNDDDGDDDDDDEEDQDFLHKFDSETKKKYIASHHPECLSFNHEETETMSRVVRDENGRIVDPYHKTLPFLTKYEKTRILGIRTKQLNEGAKPYIDVNATIIDGYIIAQLEMEHKRLPFIIRRPIPNGGSELWKLQDLEIIC